MGLLETGCTTRQFNLHSIVGQHYFSKKLGKKKKSGVSENFLLKSFRGEKDKGK